MKHIVLKLFIALLFLLPVHWVMADTDVSVNAMPAVDSVIPSASIEKAPDSDKVSLDLKGMDVQEVVKMLAAKGNLNVVIGNEVRGKVNILLKNVNLMDAFEIVLVANDLAYDKRGDIIYVMSQREYEATYGERFADKTAARIFQLKFAKAADLGKALSQMKTKIGKIIVDEGSNTLVVIDSPVVMSQISDAVEKMDSSTVTKVFSLTYAKAADIKTKVAETLTPGVGTIQIDERTNKLVVTDLEKKMVKIQEMVTAFDDKLQQVFIESKIIQITLSDKYKMGVDWGSFFNSLHKSGSIKTAFGLADKDSLTPGAQVLVGSGDPANDYNVMIQALKTVGDANLLSSPRITVLNNQEAKILVGKTQPYATGTVTQGTSTTTTSSTLQFIDIGVKLYVTPTVNRDGFITMKIKPEVSSSTEVYTYGSPATTVPIVETTQAETWVTVKDGTTIMIAGLIKDERKNSVDKVPLLGDIPFIKNAFRKTNKEVLKQELVLFLTPHIVTGESDYLEAPQTPPMGEKKFTVSPDSVFEKRPRVDMNPAMFKEAKKVSSKVQGVGASETVKTMIPAVPDEYYYQVKEKIADRITVPKGKDFDAHKGKVTVQFVLSSKGVLVGVPDVLMSSNDLLSATVVKAVAAAAPFAAFPGEPGQNDKRFVVDIDLE